MVKVIQVAKNSLADLNGIRCGDHLVSINRHPVRDFLDLYFYQADENLKIAVLRDDNELLFKIRKNVDETLGLELAGPHLKACGNDCIFCFIKQNPAGIRRAIYFCDEDYRYSFLLGNYITLTNLSEDEMARIVDQRLSPLYVSVHATQDAVRQKIFRLKRPDHLLEKITYLARNRIDLHTQIVLMPEINDGAVLEKTLADLYAFRQSILSVAIVPVGLTRHRRNLPALRSVNAEFARKLLRNIPRWNRLYVNRDGEHWVFPADEFYLLTEKKLPARKFYGSYHQIENGIGLSRDFLDDFHRQSRRLPDVIGSVKKVLFVTGTLAAPMIRQHVAGRLNQIQNFHVDILPVVNNFFGASVTVAGLLTGQDIIEQSRHVDNYNLVVLPPRVINEDGVLLDDIYPGQIATALQKPVRIWDGDFRKLVEEKNG